MIQNVQVEGLHIVEKFVGSWKLNFIFLILLLNKFKFYNTQLYSLSKAMLVAFMYMLSIQQWKHVSKLKKKWRYDLKKTDDANNKK